MLAHCTAKDDPQIAAADRSGDADSQLISQVMRARFERELVRADERMRGESAAARKGAMDRLKNMKKLRLEEIELEDRAAQGGAGQQQPGAAPSSGQAPKP
jgi:hypothetical protein